MLRRSSLAALALTACNQVYGLTGVHEIDAAFYDANTATCPPIGAIPEFDHGDLREIIPQDCVEYTRGEDDTRALARCGSAIVEGTPDGPLSQAPGLDASTYYRPRISPDGDFATIEHGNETIVVHRDAGAWAPVAVLGSNLGPVSEPTRNPNARVLVTLPTDEIHELVDDGASWRDVATHPIPRGQTLHLSPDGLRGWSAPPFSDADTVYFDRASVDAQFVVRGSIARSAGFGTVFITSDCGRLYFSTLQSIWFAHRPYR